MNAKRRQKQRVKQPAVLDLPVVKNEQYEMEIVGLTHDGQGVGHVKGFTLFVQQALPGEQVFVKVMKLKKKYGYARLMKRLTDSPNRVAPPCDIYDRCGGCQLQHLSDEGQLAMKHKLVADNMEKIGKLHVKVLPVIGMQEPWHYRNKAAVPMGIEEGKVVAGFYAKSSHRIVDMDRCLIQHPSNDDVIRIVKHTAQELGISTYDEEAHQGLLRHVMVRTAYETKEVMVVLVTNGSELPHQAEWVRRIREQVPQVKSICHNINTRRTNVIMGTETRLLWGNEVIFDTIGDVKFAISARSFYQVNPVQTEVLYGKALEYAQLTGEETVIDAYCGIGTISLFLAQKAKQVYGVEIVPEAIEDARKNAELNGMTNVSFEVGPAEEVIPAWKEQGIVADVMVVDPPRKGCDPALLQTMIEMKPKRIVYVSCDSATLARDLRVLEDGGFEVKQVQPVDMFPHTSHVECCSLLVRKD
ncbi:23S rRNA (uracil(1939)-C(5))-methyltransferase RlmD [Marinicrinis sediminis]|uniref:23S rRNA (Uracil(1939)-C(5))-methyltransferase RlmD n=1 Tax=Marinicrinis sediminis TaxID=1652465 RepID=A0ABW5RAW0_9BACL